MLFHVELFEHDYAFGWIGDILYELFGTKLNRDLAGTKTRVQRIPCRVGRIVAVYLLDILGLLIVSNQDRKRLNQPSAVLRDEPLIRLKKSVE